MGREDIMQENKKYHITQNCCGLWLGPEGRNLKLPMEHLTSAAFFAAPFLATLGVLLLTGRGGLPPLPPADLLSLLASLVPCKR